MLESKSIMVVALSVFSGLLTQAQNAPLSSRTTSRPPAVEYLYPEQVTIAAGKESVVVLHFRVAAGMHINSHTPKEQELIPTTFSIPDSSGVRLDAASYPQGVEFVLPVDPTTKLDVYTGEFAIHTRLTATAGDHMVEARLRYQACDDNACMPPKTITVPIDIVGK